MPPDADEDDAIDAAFTDRKWTQHDLDLLHQMVKEYEFSRVLRRRAKWWLLWWLGLPATILAFWEPLEKLWRGITSLRGH